MIRILGALLALFALSQSVHAQYFSEGFESGLVPYANVGNHATVTALNLSTGTWFAHNISNGGNVPGSATGVFSYTSPPNGPFTAQSGSLYAAMNFEATDFINGGDIDVYLMSPTVTFNNGDTISFFTRTLTSSAFPDRMRLLLSTNGTSTNTADFTTSLLSINEALELNTYPNDWTQFNITISGLSGPTSGRFAFNYNVTDSSINGNIVAIDRVEYIPIPEPMSIGFIGVACVAAFGRCRRRPA
jgi:hypothetical protein